MDKNSQSTSSQRFEILRELALAGVQGSDLSSCVRQALEGAARSLGLEAGQVILWNNSGEPVVNESFASSEADAQALRELEEELFDSLRRKRQLRSAFMTFGGERPLTAFTIPIYRKENTFGATLGVKAGEVKLYTEDAFLESVAAVISLTALVEIQQALTSGGSGADQELIDRERLKAVMEMAVTVNHEINNPLTAALGNVQLILMQSDKLDPDLRRKLEVVEKSALQIKDVTQRLLSIREARSVTYAGKEKMIDISPPDADSGKPDKKSNKKK